jgi:hypothetical protein
MLSTPLDLMCRTALQMYSSSGKPEVYPGEDKAAFLRREMAVLDLCPPCFSSQCVSTASDPRHQAPPFQSTAPIEYP